IHKTPRAVWARHRRWAIMRHRLGGALYWGEAFAGGLPWALAASATGAWVPASLLLALRYLLEGRLAAAIDRPHGLVDRLLLPVRDLFAFAVFFAGLSGRFVRWRGRALAVGPDTRIGGRATGTLSGPLRAPTDERGNVAPELSPREAPAR
ncbi:MAG: hypothetical protein ACM3NW_10365, partial [Syntrophomonadaceae bacterium]